MAWRLSSVWSARYDGAAEERSSEHGVGRWLHELPAAGVLAEVAAIDHWPTDRPALEIEADVA